MNYSNYSFTLNLQIHQSQISIPVSLNDTARKLYITFIDGRKPYTIPDGCRAIFVGFKPDGTTLFNDCIIQENKTVIYEFTEQTANVEGIVNCEIRLYGKDGKQLTSSQFIMIVDENVTRDISLSENESTAIDNIIHAEIGRVEAEAAREAAEKSRKELADFLATSGGVIVSDEEPQEELANVWVDDSPEKEEIRLLDSTDIAQELADNDEKIPSVALLKKSLDELETGASGKDGLTPYIKDGNWWIGETDTGVKAEGKDGKDGENGKDGTNGVDGEDGVDGKDGADGKDGVSATHSWTGTTLTITSASGTSSADLKGADGKDGKDGKDGVDGKDGAKGADGYTPVNGVDYNTPADKSEFSQYIASELAKRGQLKPEFANSIEECTDTTKLYVLPDGYIYAYTKKTVEVIHNANDGTGFKNVRPTASAGTTKDDNNTKNGLFTTAPIAVDSSWSDCIVTISGLEKLVPTFYGTLYVYFFDANGNYIAYLANNQLGLSTSAEVELTLPLSVDIATVTTKASQYWKQSGYIRVAVGVKLGAEITDADIAPLVINFERLNTVEDKYGWYSTGHAFVPANYEDRIIALEEETIGLQTDIEQLKKAVGTSPSNSGAVWYAVGDSITKGYGVGADNCWVKYVKQYNGYDAEKSKNLGISGLGFAKSDPNYSKTARTVVDENSFAEVDLVTVAIGINDWKEPFSIDTVKSEMRYCFEKILTDNPYCKIIFIVPFNMRNKGNESTNWALGYSGSDVTGGTLQNFIDTQKSVCEEYGIQVIDMTKDSVINKKNITTLLYDGIHPDAECHKALGRELARRITFA